MEKATLNNSAGQKIAAVIHRPKQRTEKLVILCPGNLDSKDYPHLIDLAEKLTERGYTAVRFDPTGTWDSGGDVSQYTVTQYLDDIRCVLEHMLAEHTYTDILLGGHSRGGQLSIFYAARDPRISTVLGIMPASLPADGKARENWEKSGIRISKRDLPFGKDGEKEFKLPFSHVLDRDKYNAITDAGKTKARMILVAGETDDAIPPSQVQNIFNHANEPKKFLVIKGIGHDYRHSLTEIDTVNKEILKALEV